jgi:D-sorbitol dehydrogenase (acceptor)
MQLKDKVVIISGATSGIGKACALAFGTAGAKVVITGRSQPKIDNALVQLQNEGIDCLGLLADAASQEDNQKVARETIAHFGKIDILINNAAVFTAAPIIQITEADYTRTFDINVKGTLFTLQAVARHMIARGQGGKIINIASQAGRRGEALVAVYCATKAAVISLTQSAALDLIKHGINVNAISPGVVDGEHWDGVDAYFAKYENKAPGQKKAEVGAGVPFGRMGRAEDLTGMAVFLASDAAQYILGQTYNVDGGQWMS